ncbi:Hint domain-containing protein [Paracoccus cavernae]|uniref:Hint domain-containing protein n=1 Tax=Paracoccus cavernae TaxID=1571207 RepID=UPI0035F46F05
MANIDGTNDHDSLLGTAAADVINGFDGNDTIDGGAGDDLIDAGNGRDIVLVDDNSGNDTIHLGTGDDEPDAGYVQDIGDHLDAGALTQDATVVLDNFRDGTMQFGGSTVTFTGAEHIYTGSGNDTLDARGMGARTDGNTTHDGLRNGVGLHGGAGDDVIYGSDFRDTLDGGDGDDFIDSGDGEDLIESSRGNDTVYAGGGNDGIRWGNDGSVGNHDEIYGGETGEYGGGDTLNMWGGADFTVTFRDGDVEGGSASYADGNTLLFGQFEQVNTGAGNDSVDASRAYSGSGTIGVNVWTLSGDDRLVGSAGADTLHGGHGADTIIGGAGDDIIMVNDFLFGDRNFPDTQEDIVIFADGGGNDTLMNWNAPVQGADGSWTTIDKLDVSGLHDADGNPVDVNDITIGVDQWGWAILQFPNGETITLDGVRPDQVDSPAKLHALGIPCFARGTMIRCASGRQVAVEDLAVGQLVQTRDHGLRPIRWVGSRKLSAADLDEAPKLQPIRIAAGALGFDTPSTDLMVSPQHRILVRSAIAQRMFGAPEVLVAARQLLGVEGISVAEVDSVEYFHILFDSHEILISNGAETESLFTGSEALKSVGPAAREEIFTLFPALREGELPVPARPFAQGRRAKHMAERHIRNAHPLLDRAF